MNSDAADTARLLKPARAGDQEALNSLDPMDREVLSLRHFEDLEPGRDGPVVGNPRGGRRQTLHSRVKRLKAVLTSMPGGLGSG